MRALAPDGLTTKCCQWYGSQVQKINMAAKVPRPHTVTRAAHDRCFTICTEGQVPASCITIGCASSASNSCVAHQ